MIEVFILKIKEISNICSKLKINGNNNITIIYFKKD